MHWSHNKEKIGASIHANRLNVQGIEEEDGREEKLDEDLYPIFPLNMLCGLPITLVILIL